MGMQSLSSVNITVDNTNPTPQIVRDLGFISSSVYIEVDHPEDDGFNGVVVGIYGSLDNAAFYYSPSVNLYRIEWPSGYQAVLPDGRIRTAGWLPPSRFLIVGLGQSHPGGTNFVTVHTHYMRDTGLLASN